MMYLVEGRNAHETRGQYVLSKESAYAILEEMKQDFLKVNIYEKENGEYKRIEKYEREQTEQEWLQTATTEQLVDFLFRIAYMCSYCGDEAHSSQEKMQQCHFGKCGCQRKDWEVWLKQPHTKEL